MDEVKDIALRAIAQTWSVKKSEMAETESGFDWLPGSHTVHVHISPDNREATGKSIGPGRFRIWITTDYLRSVPIENEKFVRLVGTMSKSFCPTYSLVYPPLECWKQYYDGKPADMRFFSSAYVYEDTAGWIPNFLAQMAVLQPINAERQSATPELFGGGEPAFANGKKNPTVSETLSLAETIFVPEGKKASNWIGSDEFEKFAEAKAKNDVCFGFGDKNSMMLEIPFGADTALVSFKTDEKHPQLGNGLLVATQIRSSQRFEDVCTETAWLNFFESTFWTDFPQLGCWHPQETSNGGANWAHSCFIPNAVFAPGLVENFAYWAIGRVQWARRTIFPDLKDLTMTQILDQRFGKS